MFFILAADIGHLGRFDPSMLDDHAIMELFFTPDNFDAARDTLGGDPDDSCTWKQVKCSPDGHIIKIDWCSYNIGKIAGSFDFTKYPQHIVYLNLYDEQFVGEVKTAALPATMQDLTLQACGFTGTLDVGALPPSLESLVVADNRVTALINLCNFPESLRCFCVHEVNIGEKSIRIGHLPDNGLILRLEKCRFAGAECENPGDETRVKLQFGH